MKRLTVLLHEQTGRWAAAIAGLLPATAQLVQVRGSDQCLWHVAAAPGCMIALEFTASNAQEMVPLACQITRRFPWSTIVALVGREVVDGEQLAREAGAVHVFNSPRELVGCRETLERHFARIPLEPVEFAESIWHSLPWNSAAKA